jgi:hypothetical protein
MQQASKTRQGCLAPTQPTYPPAHAPSSLSSPPLPPREAGVLTSCTFLASARLSSARLSSAQLSSAAVLDLGLP